MKQGCCAEVPATGWQAQRYVESKPSEQAPRVAIESGAEVVPCDEARTGEAFVPPRKRYSTEETKILRSGDKPVTIASGEAT